MRENDVPIENDFSNLKELKSMFDIFEVFKRISQKNREKDFYVILQYVL